MRFVSDNDDIRPIAQHRVFNFGRVPAGISLEGELFDRREDHPAAFDLQLLDIFRLRTNLSGAGDSIDRYQGRRPREAKATK
jgi:hypothetical protein